MSRHAAVSGHAEPESHHELDFWSSAPSVSHLNAAERIGGEAASSSGQSLGAIQEREGDALNGNPRSGDGTVQGGVSGEQAAFLVSNSPEQFPEGSASVASGAADSGGFVPAGYCEANNLELQVRREDQEPGEFLLQNSLLNTWPWDQEIARPGYHTTANAIATELRQPHFSGSGQHRPPAQAASFQGYAVQNRAGTSRMAGPGAPAGGAVIASSAKKIHKADREKLRRDKLNEHFVELAAVLDPERPKNDKARVLGDGLEVVRELHQEVKRLRMEHTSLEEESKELVQEKGELREERATLRAEMEQLQVELYRRLLPCLGSYDPSAWGAMLGYAMPPPPPPPAAQPADALASGGRPSSPPPQQQPPSQATVPPPQAQPQPQSQQHQMPLPMPYAQHPPPGMPYMPLNPAAIAAYAAAMQSPYQHMLGMQPAPAHPSDPHPYFPHHPYVQHPGPYARPPMPPPPNPPSHNVERPFPQYPLLPQPLLGMPSQPHPSYLSLLSAPQSHPSAASLTAGFGGGVFPSFLPGMPSLPTPPAQHIPLPYHHQHAPAPPQQNLHHPMATFPYPPITAPPATGQASSAIPPPQPGPQAAQPPTQGPEYWQLYQQPAAAGTSVDEAAACAADEADGSAQQAAARSGEPSSSATAGRAWAGQEEGADGPRASAQSSATANSQPPPVGRPPDSSDRRIWIPDQSSSWPESSRSHFPSPPPPDPGV